MTDETSAARGRRIPVQLSEDAAARRAAFETVSGEREWRDAKAAALLDARSVEKGLDGRWPCYVARCYDGTDPESALHDPASLTLLHSSRSRDLYRFPALKSVRDKSIPEEWARDTDRSPVCRDCRNAMRDFVMFDD